jgi:hypothetical protein
MPKAVAMRNSIHTMNKEKNLVGQSHYYILLQAESKLWATIDIGTCTQ